MVMSSHVNVHSLLLEVVMQIGLLLTIMRDIGGGGGGGVAGSNRGNSRLPHLRGKGVDIMSMSLDLLDNLGSFSLWHYYIGYQIIFQNVVLFFLV